MVSIAALSCANAFMGADTVFSLLPDGALFSFSKDGPVLRKDHGTWYRMRDGGRRFTTGASSAVIIILEG